MSIISRSVLQKLTNSLHKVHADKVVCTLPNTWHKPIRTKYDIAHAHTATNEKMGSTKKLITRLSKIHNKRVNKEYTTNTRPKIPLITGAPLNNVIRESSNTELLQTASKSHEHRHNMANTKNNTLSLHTKEERDSQAQDNDNV